MKTHGVSIASSGAVVDITASGFTLGKDKELTLNDVPVKTHQATAFTFPATDDGSVSLTLTDGEEKVTVSGVTYTAGGENVTLRLDSEGKLTLTGGKLALTWAVNAGILQGSNSLLLPQAECTRGQLLTLLYRLLVNKISAKAAEIEGFQPLLRVLTIFVFCCGFVTSHMQ